MSMHRLLDQPIIRHRSDGIDFLRGVLALWVMVAHLVPWAAYVTGRPQPRTIEAALAGLAKIFQTNGETHPAVLGFIVLSGYCIHRNGARRDSGFTLNGYALRRFFRIWPVYALAVLVGIAAFSVSFAQNPAAAAALTGTPEISLSCTAAKFAGISAIYAPLNACSFQGNAPLNTAMVEIWLYALYAVVVVYLIRGGSVNRAMLTIGAMYGGALIFVLARPEYVGWWHNGSVFSFAVYWWIGAMFVRSNAPPRTLLVAIGALWVALTSALIWDAAHHLVVVEARKLMLAGWFGWIVYYLDHASHRWYVAASKIGVAGYSIYALHAPVLVLLLISGVNAGVAMAITLALAALVYRYFEKPLTDRGKALASARMAAATVPA